MRQKVSVSVWKAICGVVLSTWSCLLPARPVRRRTLS